MSDRAVTQAPACITTCSLYLTMMMLYKAYYIKNTLIMLSRYQLTWAAIRCWASPFAAVGNPCPPPAAAPVLSVWIFVDRDILHVFNSPVSSCHSVILTKDDSKTAVAEALHRTPVAVLCSWQARGVFGRHPWLKRCLQTAYVSCVVQLKAETNAMQEFKYCLISALSCNSIWAQS